MSKHSRRADAQKQPLPDQTVQYYKKKKKTADDLSEPGELPVITLQKEIPATELHDM